MKFFLYNDKPDVTCNSQHPLCSKEKTSIYIFFLVFFFTNEYLLNSFKIKVN